jgi:putative transcriptional regulator
MIRVKLDYQLLERRLKLRDLAARTGFALNNLSILKTNKARAIRFSTLNRLCKALKCTPGDLLEYVKDSKKTKKKAKKETKKKTKKQTRKKVKKQTGKHAKKQTRKKVKKQTGKKAKKKVKKQTRKKTKKKSKRK